ncbi:NitT/TauT family transport system permease protein [Haloactinopolyspora alba]|uniref:NitT/TauT family transport system permease protein n=1 Tax=Haloactinopolyspora alba TaxID=648780 RepID=A0A2P8E7N4_9ACTN|nr:ABC transporter permease [Haloactinopolyspora alba]PSL05470.1 NitT/TauT family transport system permease protein [Haloactinopolyspora alba]
MTSKEAEALGKTTRPRTGSRHPLQRIGLPLVGVVLLIATWEVTVWLNDLDSIVMPRPMEVLRALGDLVVSGEFWDDVVVSLTEFGSGYVIGVFAGVVVGVLMAEFSVFRATVHPVVEALRFIVPFAWIPLVILWFGTSLLGKTLLVAYATFFVMVVSAAKAMQQVDPTLTKVGRMLGMSRWRLAFAVQLRAAAPTIASSARAAAAIAWIAVVAAEYVGASAGLGVLIINASTSLQTDVVIAGMVVIGLVGAGVSAVIGWLSRSYLSYV